MTLLLSPLLVVVGCWMRKSWNWNCLSSKADDASHAVPICILQLTRSTMMMVTVAT